MVDFIADDQVEINHLKELGHIADTGHVVLSHRSSSGLVVTQGNVDFIIRGDHIGYQQGYPTSGNVTSLLIKIDDTDAYQFSHFNFTVPQLEGYLSQDPEKAIAQILADDDRITGSQFDDTLYGYRGNDLVRGGKGDDTINGGPGNDRLVGQLGDDRIFGTDGNDTLNGGAGTDLLSGGKGNDRFVFDSHLDETTNLDRINGFDAAHDRIVLDLSIFDQIAPGAVLAAAAFHAGAAADTAEERILYDASTGNLLYDADGNGATGAVAFADLAPNLNLAHNDFLLAA